MSPEKQPPAVLYKYLDAAGAMAFLERPQLRFKDWRELDDSMEILPGFREKTEAEIQFEAKARFEQANGKLRFEACEVFARETGKIDPAYLEGLLRKIIHEENECALAVCSMSARPDSGAMWAHYGENQRGIVFGVRPESFTNRSYKVREVIYSETRPQIPFGIIDRAAQLRAILTKSHDWDHQIEWRTLASKPDQITIADSEVACVILGFDASPEVRAAARKLGERGVAIREAYPDPAMHRIAFRDSATLKAK